MVNFKPPPTEEPVALVDGEVADGGKKEGDEDDEQEAEATAAGVDLPEFELERLDGEVALAEEEDDADMPLRVNIMFDDDAVGVFSLMVGNDETEASDDDGETAAVDCSDDIESSLRFFGSACNDDCTILLLDDDAGRVSENTIEDEEDEDNETVGEVAG
jgi:hypothetical protein